MPPTEGPPSPTPTPRTSLALAPAPGPPTRAVLVGLLIGLVSAAVGIWVGVATLPTSDELQRATLEEIGLDPDLLDNPLIGPIFDEVAARVQDRVLDDARRSLVLAVVASATVAAGGVLVVVLTTRRRRGDSTRMVQTDDGLSGRPRRTEP